MYLPMLRPASREDADAVVSRIDRLSLSSLVDHVSVEEAIVKVSEAWANIALFLVASELKTVSC